MAGGILARAPEYEYSRRWVEEHNPSDKIPATDRIFVAYSTSSSLILLFRESISLREIIDQTSAKGKKVKVTILRDSHKTGPVFEEMVAPSDRPKFTLKARDVIWVTDVR